MQLLKACPDLLQGGRSAGDRNMTVFFSRWCGISRRLQKVASGATDCRNQPLAWLPGPGKQGEARADVLEHTSNLEFFL